MPLGSDPEADLVLASYAAFARGDIEAAVAPLTEWTEWFEPEEFLMGGRRVGRAAVTEYLHASRAAWRELTSTPTAHRVGEHIVVVHAVSGTLADGSKAEATVADVYTIRDGAVVSMKATADIEAALRGEP